MSAQYPYDEFDDLPDDAPVGVHRKQQSPWQTVLPFLLVLIIVPLLAWGATELIKGRGTDIEVPPVAGQSEQEQSSQSTNPIAPLPEDGPTGAPDNPAEAEEAEEEKPAEEKPAEVAANMEASIAVLNASGVEGFAAQNQVRLAEAGFTNAWADNAADAGWTQSAVYFRDASLQPTAAKVAEVLGIPTVLEDAAVTGELDIVVILATAG
ncbi:LytR C-terminal domain-containing protein [Actinomycetaceae bacterium MB13-C1-2]|nr:LytR C-terminal domain-containing protein [Actinomycetaceae bacterium MB13-C1-2]